MRFIPSLKNIIVFAFFSLLLNCSSFANVQTDEVEMCLSQIKDKSYQIKKCQANQVLPEECDMLLQPSILLTLQCAKNGATSKQVNTAISQGEKRVKASISASPYQQIKRKLDKSPFFIHPEKANFIVYSRQCADYKDKLFRIVAYTINDGQAKFVASPIKPTTCLSTTNLDKKYPILSARLPLPAQGFFRACHGCPQANHIGRETQNAPFQKVCRSLSR